MSVVSRVFVCIREGVYRHEIVGVFETLNEAIEKSRIAIEAEHDRYHAVEIIQALIGACIWPDPERSAARVEWVPAPAKAPGDHSNNAWQAERKRRLDNGSWKLTLAEPHAHD